MKKGQSQKDADYISSFTQSVQNKPVHTNRKTIRYYQGHKVFRMDESTQTGNRLSNIKGLEAGAGILNIKGYREYFGVM